MSISSPLPNPMPEAYQSLVTMCKLIKMCEETDVLSPHFTRQVITVAKKVADENKSKDNVLGDFYTFCEYFRPVADKKTMNEELLKFMEEVIHEWLSP